MPWSNQTGGGGWRGGGSGGNSGGPWGQGPQSPRPGSGNSPDLEEILRRGQDRLKRALPGGSGPSGNSSFALIAAVLVVLAIVWALNAIHMVQPGEYGVKVFLGKPRDQLEEPGLAFTAWPLETFETVPAVENQLAVGRDTTGQSGLMLSGDQNLVNVQFAVLYQITDPQAYLFNVADPQGLLRQTAQSAMREVVGRNPVDDLFRDARASIAEQVRSIMQETLDRYGSGMRINAVSIEETAPPQQVASSFDEVQRASQDQDRYVDEANIYRNKKLGEARGQAVQYRQDAAAFKDRVVQEAQGESQRFVSILNEYLKTPDITKRRLWVETIENALSKSNKVIVEGGAANASGIVPYLPLNELPRQQTAPPNANISGAPPLQSTGASRLNPANALGSRGTSLSSGGEGDAR